jgi:hypothetical protein
MMRVDDTRIPSGGKVKVRCPHCQGIGTAEHSPSAASADGGRVVEPAPEQIPLPPVVPAAGDSAQDDTSAGFDLKLPEDSFQSFRFPAEAEVDRPMLRRSAHGRKILLWLGISLAVIGVFALLVNIILPGPQGGKLF